MPAAYILYVDIHTDLCAVRRNASKISNICKLIAVIKADAYGHGSVITAKALARIADSFAVATETEAKELLAAGVDRDILILHPCRYPRLTAENVIYTLTCLRDVAAFSGRRTAIKLNTGMNRFGADAENAVTLIAAAKENTLVSSVYSHFYDAADRSAVQRQLDDFESMTRGCDLSRHIVSSGALTAEVPYGIARCGIALYGGIKGYLPAMTVTAEVLETRRVHTGEHVGYGSGTLRKDAYIAVTDIGHAHGYRRLGKARYMYVAGRRRKVVSVCMDCTLVECGRETKAGDIVEVMGGHISPSELARSFGTNEYEVFTSLGAKRT